MTKTLAGARGTVCGGVYAPVCALTLPHGARLIALPPQLIIFQVTPRLGLLGSLFAVAAKVSFPAGRSSISTVVNVEVIASIILEVSANAVLVALVSGVEVAVNEYVPAIMNVRLLNVATPLTAATVVVPPTFAGVELMVIGAVELVTTLLLASSTLTLTAAKGVTLPPSGLLAGGCGVKTSCTGVPGVTLKAVLIAPVRLAALAASV